MQNYELTFLTRNDLKEKVVQKEIEAAGGKIAEVKSSGQKELAYPIKKENRGFYTTVIMTIDPQKIGNLNAKLNLKAEVLRHLILSTKPAKIPKLKEKAISPPAAAIEAKKEIPEKEAAIAPEKEPKAKAEITKKKTPKGPAPIKPKKTEKIQKEELAPEERLKALDKKLDELLKE